MTPQEFIAALEQQSSAKEADVKGTLVQNAITGVANAGKRFLERAPAVQNFMRAPVNSTMHAGLRTLEGTGNLGQKAMEMGRKGLNYVDDTARHTLNVPQAAGPKRLGNRAVAPLQRATRFTDSTGQIRVNNLHPTSLGAGLATAGGGLMGAKYMLGGYKGGPVPAPQRQPQQPQQPRQQGDGLMDMWNGLPIEARYAIGAGVPLALMGAFAGGNGNSGLGMGMGAAGLGLAGLGAAQGGYLGKNMQGGAQSIMNTLNGRGQDPHYSAYLQGNLRNDLDNNSTRGVKKSSSLQSFGALVEKTSSGRCWTGYEPVPGKAPYSNDSCRPKGQKAKKKPAEKTAIAGCGVTAMSVTPSSRGTVKNISDHMASTPSPKPTDAENQTQKASQAYQWAAQLRADMDKEAFLGGMARSVGNAIGGAGNYVQTGLNNFADRSEQAGKDMYYGGMRTLNKITNPFNQAGAAIGGFGSGLVQGAKNIAALPGQVTTAAGNAISNGIDTVAALPGQAATAAGNAIQSGVDTAKSYIPSVRNPFHYPGQPSQPGQPGQPAGAM